MSGFLVIFVPLLYICDRMCFPPYSTWIAILTFFSGLPVIFPTFYHHTFCSLPPKSKLQLENFSKMSTSSVPPTSKQAHRLHLYSRQQTHPHSHPLQTDCALHSCCPATSRTTMHSLSPHPHACTKEHCPAANNNDFHFRYKVLRQPVRTPNTPRDFR